MYSEAKQRFEANKRDIDLLWLIYKDSATTGKTNERRRSILNSAAIVFISAFWESYVEDVAMEAFDFLLANASQADVIPAKIRTLASRKLIAAKDERVIWTLAGDGWKKVLQTHRDEVHDEWIKSFHSPKSQSVNKLFFELLEMRNLSENWVSETMPSAQATKKLDHYMTIRGNIAHRINHENKIYKNDVKDFLGHIATLIEKSDTAISIHLQSLTGVSPW